VQTLEMAGADIPMKEQVQKLKQVVKTGAEMSEIHRKVFVDFPAHMGLRTPGKH